MPAPNRAGGLVNNNAAPIQGSIDRLEGRCFLLTMVAIVTFAVVAILTAVVARSLWPCDPHTLAAFGTPLSQLLPLL
jgi:hypothetical protein